MGLPPRRGYGAFAAALIAATTLSIGAQDAPQQPPIFRGTTETVAVYATVIDRYGEMIRDLERDDFIVEDDGRRQELTVFVKGLQPITAAVLVDTSASMTLNLELARMAAEQFVIRMLPGDQVRVGSFSDRLDLSRSFTSDRDELLKALREDLHIGNPTELWDAVDETMTELAPLGGRRILLLMTDGVDTISTTTAADVLERARADELMIYIVQFRSTTRAQLAEMPLSAGANVAFSDPRRWTAPPTDALRRLAAQTGGGHFQLNQYDDLNATFTQVMQELHYQYVLGFTPQRLDGRVHELRVRTEDEELTVRARRSYRAPEGGTVRPPL
jgi:Ca-activated chloride channel family protein